MAHSTPALVVLHGISEADEAGSTLADSQVIEPLLTTNALADLLDSYDDVPAFLNDLLGDSSSSSLNDLASLDRSVADILTRLSILSQDTSAHLERSIHDISRTVPRLTYDLQFMRESAASVRQSLQSVQDKARLGGNEMQVDDGKDDTKKILDRMTYLDTVKSRMEDARDVLREAESWSSLEQETTSLLANSSYRKAAARLAEASTSIQVFQNTPAEYTTRKNLLVSLQNQLEARVNAVLTETVKAEARRDAIESPDDEEKMDLKDIYDIYGLIEREAEFMEAYFAARRSELLKSWESVKLAEEYSTNGAEEQPADPFSIFLPRFFASFHAAIAHEVIAIPKVFPDPVATLISFIQTTYEALNPSFAQRLQMLADHHGGLVLPQLILAWKSTTDFVTSTRGLVEEMVAAVGGDPSPALATSPSPMDQPSEGTQTGHRRRSSSITATNSAKRASRRFSRPYGTSGSIGSSLALPSSRGDDTLRNWEPTFLEPFLDYQSDYGALEKKLLAYELRSDSVFTKAIERRTDAPRVLMDRMTRLQSLADEAVARCTAFTHGYALTGLVDAVDSAVKTAIRDSTALLEAAASKEIKSASSNSDGLDELDDLGSLDYSEEDWASFQLGLHILQTCRVVRDRILAIERMIMDLAHKVDEDMERRRSGNATPGDAGTSRTTLSMLQQTSLHSAELQRMLERSRGRIANGPLLPDGTGSMKELTRDSQLLLQHIILSPLRLLLSSYAGLPVWSQPDKVVRRGELHVPTFSLSPTDTITHVSEGLLNLLRLFEVYASDSGLSFSLETLPFIDQDALRELSGEEAELPAMDGSHRPLSSPGILAGGPAGLSSSPASPAAPASKEPPPELVLTSWVSSLALSLLSHLTKSVLPSIPPPLSTAGSAQLAADLAYLSNAISALDVEWEELERWREGSEVRSEVELRGKIGALGRREEAGVLRAVGRLRGWQL